MCNTKSEKKMKKYLMFVGSAVLMLALASCGGNTNGGNTETPQEEVMKDVKAPTWEKFVVVTQEDVTIYKAADETSAKRMVCYEDAESDMVDIVHNWSDEPAPAGYLQESLLVYPDGVYPCLGEEGDFYKVALCGLYDKDDEVGYIAKSAAQEIKPEPITDAMAFNKNCSWAHLRYFPDGKYKNMVIRTKYDELEGECINIGRLIDGVVALPVKYNIDCYDNTEIDSLQVFTEEYEGGEYISMQYPSSLKYHDDVDCSLIMDLAKLSDEQVDKLYGLVVKGEPEYVEYLYFFPTIESEFDRFQSFYVKAQ